MAKLTVVLLFGGRSGEHSVSCATAGGILSAIDRERFDVIPVGITRDGAFVLQPADPELYTMNPERLPMVTDNGTRVRFPDTIHSRDLTVVDGDGSERVIGRIDVVLPILHGRYGEDGTIQGMLELLDIPHVGAGVLASSLAINKHLAKTVFQAAGLPVVPWYSIRREDWLLSQQSAYDAAARLGLPVFVKPSRAGSSIGVSKVHSEAELERAMLTAFAEDDVALIEACASGRELEIAVLGGGPGQPPRASVAGEVRFTGRDLYDFEAKYLAGSGVELICPAQLDPDQLSRIQALAIAAFTAIEAKGLARVDFFLTDAGFLINEINTMPGFTPISMFPRCWETSGLNYPDLLTELIETEVARQHAGLATATTVG